MFAETNGISSQFHEVGNDGAETKVSLKSEMNATEHEITVDDVLVETLEDLVKAKEFKDIFFDDDDFLKDSTTDKTTITVALKYGNSKSYSWTRL